MTRNQGEGGRREKHSIANSVTWRMFSCSMDDCNKLSDVFLLLLSRDSHGGKEKVGADESVKQDDPREVSQRRFSPATTLNNLLAASHVQLPSSVSADCSSYLSPFNSVNAIQIGKCILKYLSHRKNLSSPVWTGATRCFEIVPTGT